MDEFILADTILSNLGLPSKLNPKHTFTTHDLLLCLLIYGNIKNQAEFLNMQDSKLEHIIERELKPLIKIPKVRQKQWRQFLLSILELKKCPKCSKLLPIEQFGKDATKDSQLKVYCKTCCGVYSEKYRQCNLEKSRQTVRNHYINNVQYYLAKNAKRRAQKIQATVPWQDTVAIRKIYENTPHGYHVDHIFPLVSGWVCGLHVPNNLQYLPALVNIVKSNKRDDSVHGHTLT